MDQEKKRWMSVMVELQPGQLTECWTIWTKEEETGNIAVRIGSKYGSSIWVHPQFINFFAKNHGARLHG